MVAIATGLGRNGLQEWLIQRVSAVLLGIYVLFLTGFMLGQSEISYEEWHTLFSFWWMKYATFIVLLSLIAHAWIGLWTISTDYLKPLWIRLPFQVIVNLGFIVYFVWGVRILWSS